MPLIFNCGFSRFAVKESFHKPGTTTKEADPVQRWRHYRETLSESAQSTFAVDKSTYMKKARIIYHSFRKMNSRSRTEYFKYFSLANWNGLPDSQKSEHIIRTVMPAKYFAFQSLFPNTVRFKPQKLVQEALVENGNVGNNKVEPTQKAIKTAAKYIYLKINGHFQKTGFNVSFAEAQTKVSELELQQKKSKIPKNADVDIIKIKIQDRHIDSFYCILHQDKLDIGEYTTGELVIPGKKYKKLVLKSNGTLQQVEFTVSARKIPLSEIRKRELQRCEQLGIVHAYSDAHYEGMSNEKVTECLTEIGECPGGFNCKPKK